MSHFTCIKTKIKERDYLVEALELMGHDIQENQQLVINNPSHAEEHPEFLAEVAIRNDIGFRLNKNTGNYEVQEEWEMDDNSLELTVTRWIS